MQKYIPILFTVAIVSIANVNAQINKDSIDVLCQKIIDPNGPAVAVLLMKDGKVSYKKTFGYENIERKRKATGSTQFNIASVSKSFVAAAILQLAERGKLSLTDTIGKYLKGYAIGGKVTIHQLLSHTSGISDTSGNYKSEKLAGVNFVPFSDSLKKQGIDMVGSLYLQYVLNGYYAKYPPAINYRMQDTFLLFTPGTQYKYSNAGYAMLAKIVRAAGEMSYTDYMRRNIFIPIGMKYTHSFNTWNDSVIGHPANTHMQMDDGSYRKMFERVPDGEGSTNIYTTIDDWVNYENFLSGGIPSVLSKNSLKKMFTSHTTYRTTPKFKFGYGYGWMVSERYSANDTIHTIQHSGGTLGGSNFRVLYVDQKITLTIFYAMQHEGFTEYKWIDLVNAIEGYLKRKKMLPEL